MKTCHTRPDRLPLEEREFSDNVANRNKGNAGKPHLAEPELLKSLGTTGVRECAEAVIRGFPVFPKNGMEFLQMGFRWIL